MTDELTEEQKKEAAEVLKKAEADKNAEDKNKPLPKAPDEETEDKKNPIAEANEILANIKEQNKIMSDNIKKQERIQAEQLLGGSIPAGNEVSEADKKEAEEKKEVDRLSAGLLA